MPGVRTAATLFSVQTNQDRLSLHLPEASVTTGLLEQVGNPWQTSCLDLPSKKPGIDFFSAACIIKRKLSLDLSQHTGSVETPQTTPNLPDITPNRILTIPNTLFPPENTHLLPEIKPYTTQTATYHLKPPTYHQNPPSTTPNCLPSQTSPIPPTLA